MTDLNISSTSLLRTEPIPSNGNEPRGKWKRLIDGAREASVRGECIVLSVSPARFQSVRTNIYNRTNRKQGESVHSLYDGEREELRIWVTRD